VSIEASSYAQNAPIYNSVFAAGFRNSPLESLVFLGQTPQDFRKEAPRRGGDWDREGKGEMGTREEMG